MRMSGSKRNAAVGHEMHSPISDNQRRLRVHYREANARLAKMTDTAVCWLQMRMSGSKRNAAVDHEMHSPISDDYKRLRVHYRVGNFVRSEGEESAVYRA